GSAFTLTLGSIGNNNGTNAVTGYVIHWGDGLSATFQGAPTPNGTATHTYADGPNTDTITLDLVTQQGYFAAAGSKAVTVNNVPPAIALAGAGSVNEGTAYTLTLGPVTDPGRDTIRTFIIHWGDGINQQVFGAPNNVTRTHVYADGPATRTITVDATDEDGTFLNVGSKAVTVNNVPPAVGLIGV